MATHVTECLHMNRLFEVFLVFKRDMITLVFLFLYLYA